MSRKAEKLLKNLYPARCAFCNKITRDRTAVCPDCTEKIKAKRPIETALSNSFCVSAFPYEDIFRRGVLDFKFRGRKRGARCFALYIANAVKECYKNDCIDYITAVPLTRKQKRKRGFNQAEELGRALSRILEIPYMECLVKIKDNQLQHTLSKNERAKNVKGVYKIADKEINNLNLLLVDDIVTTGCTLEECCKILKKSGCKVLCCTLCRAY